MAKQTTETFIEKAKAIFGDKYDYSKVVYNKSNQKVTIICKKHGEFEQTPSHHLQGEQCPICAKEEALEQKRIKAHQKFIRDAKQIFGDKFDYSKVVYINQKTPVEIICPIHGSFFIKPDNFLRNNSTNRYGCQKCAKNHRYTLEEWKDVAHKVHKNKYNYDNIKEYTNAHQIIPIICPKHGLFMQEANSHLRGCGCPHCNMRKSQSELYFKLQDDLNLQLEFDYKTPWSGRQMLDIYSKDYNFAIEFNGLQHYEPIEYFGGESKFLNIQRLDGEKRIKCAENGCKLFEVRYNYTRQDYDELLSEIWKIIENYDETSNLNYGET